MAVETLKFYKLFDQITAQVIQSGDGPVHSELSNLFISIWNKEEFLQQKKSQLLYLYMGRVIKEFVIAVED